jgi:hypothetical protein
MFYHRSMPIAPRPDMCAVLTRDSWGRFGDNCAHPPTHRGLWQYADHSARILLCTAHALELDGHHQLTMLELIEHG